MPHAVLDLSRPVPPLVALVHVTGSDYLGVTGWTIWHLRHTTCTERTDLHLLTMLSLDDSAMHACQSVFSTPNNINSCHDQFLDGSASCFGKSCWCTAADLVQEAAHGAAGGSTKTTHDSLWRGQVGAKPKVRTMHYICILRWSTVKLAPRQQRAYHTSVWHEQLLPSCEPC